MDCNTRIYTVTGYIGLLAAILDFKMAAISKHNLVYISTFELPRDLKTVAIHTIMILRIAIKTHKKLVVFFVLVTILDFKMATIILD